MRKTYVFDIDGTLAQRVNRSPFDWKRVGEDEPIEHVITILQSLLSSGFDIVFVSGRDEVCRMQTTLWLEHHTAIPAEHITLFMRPEGNYEKDTIVKERIYHENLKDNYDIAAVFDDRPVVVRMWLDLYVPVVTVGNPYHEF